MLTPQSNDALGSLMAPVACPKCSVVVCEITSGGWRFEPASGCIDLRSTDWGAKGELEWCPTLAVAMPDEVFWPGRSHRDIVKQVAAGLSFLNISTWLRKAGDFHEPAVPSRSW